MLICMLHLGCNTHRPTEAGSTCAGENPVYKELAAIQAEKGVTLQTPKLPQGGAAAGICNDTCQRQKAKQLGGK